MEETKKCMFCNETAKYNSRQQDFADVVDCPNCGHYVAEIGRINQDVHLISGLIREKNDLGLEIEKITKGNILNLLNDPLIPRTIMQKLNKILLFYYNKSFVYGQEFEISYENYNQYAIGYAHNKDEYLRMVESLIEIGYFKDESSNLQTKRFTLTLEGLQEAEELLTAKLPTNKVFVAMGFMEDLLRAHREAIQPACKECGFDAFLVSETEHNRDINDKIIADIKMSKFVITDFTYNNAGAYFEAGYAQGRGLEVIRTCKKEWFDRDENRLHFDVNHYNFIIWENYEDLKEKLINRIKATILL